MSVRVLRRLTGAAALSVAALMASPALAAAHTHVCSGTFANPGVLSGTYHGNVLVKGICFVNDGPAKVYGSVTVSTDSGLAAVFGRNDSRLSVEGNIRVNREGVLFLGCLPSSSPCLDDSQDNPTLSSHGVVEGNLIGHDALGIVVHNTAIHGNVSQAGGGGGVTCDASGVFTMIGSPVFSAYEDSTIGGSLTVQRYHSCWMGVARAHIGGKARFDGNQLADPDAIEITDNNIGGDLICTHNSMVWNSGELTGDLFPRAPKPNTVLGARVGQCVLASPLTPGGPLGPGPF